VEYYLTGLEHVHLITCGDFRFSLENEYAFPGVVALTVEGEAYGTHRLECGIEGAYFHYGGVWELCYLT
jgi:hypothetical protein